MLLSAEQLTKTYGTRVLLDGVSFYVEPGDKVGIIGVNGCGKSTLLRLLAGAEEPDGGTVRPDPNVRLSYLPQNPVFPKEHTVLEQVLLGLEGEDRTLAEYEAKTILNQLGVSRFDQRVGELSGGERRRVALAAVLARPCDVLLLDEPTNHLDDRMVNWLEDVLRRWKGALVMVTHDRYFLERIVTTMVEVEGGNLYTYEGNYDKYLERKAARLESEKASERKRQAILRREYQWVMQGPTARGTKSRERLERYEALKAQTGPAEKSTLELSARSSRLGKKTVELMRERYGSRPEDLYAAVGPSICQDCYEVSEDVIEAFRKSFREDQWNQLFYRKENGKYQLNLWKANEIIFREAGVKPEHIAVTNVCTHCNPDILFSHRTTGEKRGNLSALLALK